MTVNEILKLADLGYTKAEIEAMEKEPEVKEPEVKEPEVKEPEVKEPEVKEPEVKEPNSDLAAAIKALSDQVKAMQDANIKNAQQGKPNKEDADSVIKSFFESI